MSRTVTILYYLKAKKKIVSKLTVEVTTITDLKERGKPITDGLEKAFLMSEDTFHYFGISSANRLIDFGEYKIPIFIDKGSNPETSLFIGEVHA